MDYSNQKNIFIQTISKVSAKVIYQIRVKDFDILNKLCILCIGNELTHLVKSNKSMTAIISKLEKIYIDFWGPYDSLSQLRSTYTAILMCEYTKNM